MSLLSTGIVLLVTQSKLSANKLFTAEGADLVGVCPRNPGESVKTPSENGGVNGTCTGVRYLINKGTLMT